MPTWPLGEIQQLLEPTLAHMGYSIYGLEQSGRGGRTLRIVIDKPQGFVSIDDCERVSKVAGPLLDQSRLLPDDYALEVSSPGAERELRGRADYERFLGRRVRLRYRAGTSEVALIGTLEAVSDGGVRVRGSREDREVSWPDLIAARLVAAP
jgi:ribosome maturation factor RimP